MIGATNDIWTPAVLATVVAVLAGGYIFQDGNNFVFQDGNNFIFN